MAENLYLPIGFDENKKYAAIISVHPGGGGVNEQTAGLYAQKMAEQGYVTFAFDASYQGESGRELRFLANPLNRVGYIYSAVDYLTTLSYVDADRIGALGICAGSGVTVKVAMTERRIKALATISAVDVGAAGKSGWDGKGNFNQIPALETVAKERTAEAHGAAPMYVNNRPKGFTEAADYYLTARNQYSTVPNKLLFIGQSVAILFDGFGHADKLLTQPLLLIADSEAGSLWHSKELNEKTALKNKELFIVKGAIHMDLYDIPKYVK